MAKKKRVDIKIEAGKIGVHLQDDGYGFQLMAMTNGWQWSGIPVNDEVLSSIKEVIRQYEVQRDATL